MLKSIPELLNEAAKGLRLIDAKTAKQEIESNDGLLIDVREPAEHQVKPANGAINIPRGLLEMKMLELEKDPARPIYLHCATSARAKLSAEALTRIGYENVSVVTCDMDTIKQHF
ncbi:rhodanese-like domain-containing protein [Aestuariibacter salexigens]|uniref:rhodanese-like domain-containing protein n=1 Tax=Aestuariibacter salexigens TaxID=226010 RepID=UPI0003FE85B5|nr:rhodanese-like domain-containing protein [Aestuariibacter salexigens]